MPGLFVYFDAELAAALYNLKPMAEVRAVSPIVERGEARGKVAKGCAGRESTGLIANGNVGVKSLSEGDKERERVTDRRSPDVALSEGETGRQGGSPQEYLNA